MLTAAFTPPHPLSESRDYNMTVSSLNSIYFRRLYKLFRVRYPLTRKTKYIASIIYIHFQVGSL